MALAWILHKPGVTSPIVGVSEMFQLEKALLSLKLKLTEEEISFLEALYVPLPVLGH